eukprot:70487_1
MELQLNGYDKDQFFFKTITSFSTASNVAQGFTDTTGMIFIIDKAFGGLYEGDLRGANVQWLSNFDEYEYVILPTTCNRISESKHHKLSLNSSQNVYITSYFKTNNDPLKPHPDTVSSIMQISYAKFHQTNEEIKLDHNYIYTEHLQRKYESDLNTEQRARRNKLCHIIDCEFENADTIPSKQLDINVYNEDEMQHVHQYHPNFYLRLTTWTKTTEEDIKSRIQWDNLPSYFMQITEVDPELLDFQLHITLNEVSKKSKRIFIKDIDEKNGNGNHIAQAITIKKGKHSTEVVIQADEKPDGLYLLGLFENKNAKNTIPNSDKIHIMIVTDDGTMPPENTDYEPRCIDLETLRIVKDETNNVVHVYWKTPLETYGDIKYKVINHIDDTERETISMLPYSISFTTAFVPFKVCTIAIVDEKVYESKPSKSIFICGKEHF